MHKIESYAHTLLFMAFNIDFKFESQIDEDHIKYILMNSIVVVAVVVKNYNYFIHHLSE